MPNAHRTIQTIPKLRQPNKPDRCRNAAIGLDKGSRSGASRKILRSAIAPPVDRRRIGQLSALPATDRHPNP